MKEHSNNKAQFN